MTLRDQILTVASAFARARGLSLSRTSTLIFNDGKKLGAIERGADLHTIKFEQAMTWFSANWPNDCDWPTEIPRPVAASEPEVA